MGAYEEYQREAKLVITSDFIVQFRSGFRNTCYSGNENLFRMGWLHKLIPIYDEEHDRLIESQPLEIEDLKEAIRENVMKRVRKRDKYYSQYRISEIYEDKNFNRL